MQSAKLDLSQQRGNVELKQHTREHYQRQVYFVSVCQFILLRADDHISTEQTTVDRLLKKRNRIGKRFPDNTNPSTGEVGGPTGPEPTRFGDWERKGRVTDF
ncbi:hypothetical protein HPB47_019943 [Ixodes persulcatus]|uniref:Uncharacterized protein n=1 Tax=Ixodes persulcatus TaxID=34615 RepID=A0AC60QGU7_IXOPE|nr:hypothetical protein HPB47_019943 [Ixodes persulcatus]